MKHSQDVCVSERCDDVTDGRCDDVTDGRSDDVTDGRCDDVTDGSLLTDRLLIRMRLMVLR